MEHEDYPVDEKHREVYDAIRRELAMAMHKPAFEDTESVRMKDLAELVSIQHGYDSSFVLACIERLVANDALKKDGFHVSVPDRPEVVCLCGSTKFKDEFRAENRRLNLDGCIVISVSMFGHADGEEFDDETKAMLDRVHKRKIDISDRVHVINKDGYIGDSTESEIRYAIDREKKVTYMEPEHSLDVQLGGD